MLLMPLCEQELTRHPIFNSSAPPLCRLLERHIFCAVSSINLLKNLALADSALQTGDGQIAVKQRSATQHVAESAAVHFHLSPSITLKDVSSQHGRIRGFAQKPAVVEVSLNLQKDEISVEKKKRKKILL